MGKLITTGSRPHGHYCEYSILRIVMIVIIVRMLLVLILIILIILITFIISRMLIILVMGTHKNETTFGPPYVGDSPRRPMVLLPPSCPMAPW